MPLTRISRRFDRTPMWDAYTGELLAAKCQVTAWDNPRRDGLTTLRRAISMAYEAQLPARMTVVIGGCAWILSRYSGPDTWGDHVSRAGYIAQMARPGIVANTSEALAERGVPTFLSRAWVKDVKDISTTSEKQGQYYVYYTDGEAVQEGEFLFVDGRWHIVHNIVVGTAGLMIAECSELEADCVVEVEVLSAGEYDPVTESYAPSTVGLVKALKLTWKDDYVLNLPNQQEEQTGDIRLRFAADAAPLVSPTTRVNLQGETWQVVVVEPRKEGAVSAVMRRV